MKIVSAKSISVALMFLGLQTVSINAQEKIDLIPFSLEISSNSTNQSEILAEGILDRTVGHLEQFINSKDDIVVTNIILNTIEHYLVKEDNEYISSTSFSGSCNFKIQENSGTNAAEKDIERLQWDAFIGQGKLDYLSLLREGSSDDFLKGVTNVKLSWTVPETTRYSSILWACATGVTVALILIGVYIYCTHLRKRKSQTSSMSKRHRLKHSKLRNDPQPLELAATRSMSPIVSPGFSEGPAYFDIESNRNIGPRTVASRDTIDVNNSVDMLAWKQAREDVPFESADISRISKSDGQHTVFSKGTVDINNSVDMLAWKHQNNNIPFDADITGISNSSPNKTLNIKASTNSCSDGNSSKNNSEYLSRNALSQHNEDRFQDHARRYREKLKKKSSASSRR